MRWQGLLRVLAHRHHILSLYRLARLEGVGDHIVSVTRRCDVHAAAGSVLVEEASVLVVALASLLDDSIRLLVGRTLRSGVTLDVLPHRLG